MTMATIIKADGDIVMGHIDTDHKSLHDIVGGYLAFVRLPSFPGTHMYVDEEGLLKRRPTNMVATLLAQQDIVGDVVILGDGPGGTEADCPDTLAQHVFKLTTS